MSTLTEKDLPPGANNSYVLTPAISQETNTHTRDILNLIQERSEGMGKELFIHIDIVPEGLKFIWHCGDSPDGVDY